MARKCLKEHLTPDDGHEIRAVADELRVLVREHRGASVAPEKLKPLAYRLERLARVVDHTEASYG